MKHLHFGEALRFAFRERDFEALERLGTEIAPHCGVYEPGLDSLADHIDHADHTVGEFEPHDRYRCASSPPGSRRAVDGPRWSSA